MSGKSFASACLAFVFFAAPAFAADPMAAFYGNTLVVTSPRGVHKIAYGADHTYTSTDSDGKSSNGTWEIKGDQLCTTRVQPAPDGDRAGPHCRPAPTDKKVGDSWDATGRSGEKMSFKLVAGH